MAVSTNILKALVRYGYLTKPMRSIITNTPHKAYLYAKQISGKPFPEGEAAIATDPDWAYCYASHFKMRFPLGETVIGKDPDWAYMYALNVLNKSPFPAGEAAIRGSDVAIPYAKECLGLDQAQAEAWAAGK